MRKIYQKAIIMLSVACMGYATPACMLGMSLF